MKVNISKLGFEAFRFVFEPSWKRASDNIDWTSVCDWIGDRISWKSVSDWIGDGISWKSVSDWVCEKVRCKQAFAHGVIIDANAR